MVNIAARNGNNQKRFQKPVKHQDDPFAKIVNDLQ